ncbi:MAG: hypothetical protein GPOALKHO_001445 [Sodalis sp.]|nr:MAG: hypothetical protein GPOALKHO_001445 [Sodalis sp.]
MVGLMQTCDKRPSIIRAGSGIVLYCPGFDEFGSIAARNRDRQRDEQ